MLMKTDLKGVRTCVECALDPELRYHFKVHCRLMDRRSGYTVSNVFEVSRQRITSAESSIRLRMSKIRGSGSVSISRCVKVDIE